MDLSKIRRVYRLKLVESTTWKFQTSSKRIKEFMEFFSPPNCTSDINIFVKKNME